MDDTILKTSRLVLRYQRKSDIKFLEYLWMDEEMTKYTGGPRDKQNLIEEFRRIAEAPKKEEYDLWPVEIKNTHELIGYAGFIPKEIKGKKYIELNYYIDRTKWRKGYAKEVAKSIGMKYWTNEERSGSVKSIYIPESV